MNLNRALSDIAQIRAQLDRAEVYRGFRSLTVGVSAIFVVVGATVHQTWLQDAGDEMGAFLTLWISVAALSATVCGIEMLVRNRTSESPLTEKLHRSLIWQTMPSLLVGCVVTTAIVNESGETRIENATQFLPGLWAMIYALGLWACGANLPRLAHAATIYFMAAGAISLLMNSSGISTPASWQMVVLFGVGQLLLSAILYWKFERNSLGGDV